MESIRQGGPNKPYSVLGRRYTPMTDDAPFSERGLASWYGTKFHGQPTSSGEPYDMFAMTAAHPTLPIPSYARIRNPANGREVIVRVNDRGPFHPGRIVDLSYTAAYKLGLLRGVAPVELERITYEDIRTGRWRRDTDAEDTRLARMAPEAARVAPAPPPSAPAPAPIDATASTGTPWPTADAAAGAAATQPATAWPVASAAEPPAVAPILPDTPAALPRAANTSADATAAADPAASISRAAPSPARGFWVQLGAFRQRPGADALQQRTLAAFDWIQPALAVFSDQSFFRVQVGPYATLDEARQIGQQVGRALDLAPMVVERR